MHPKVTNQRNYNIMDKYKYLHGKKIQMICIKLIMYYKLNTTKKTTSSN